MDVARGFSLRDSNETDLSGGFNVVKFGDAIDVRGIISLVTSRLAVGTRHYRNLYAMRLHHPGSGESYWLHQDTTMYQVFSNIGHTVVLFSRE